MPEPGPGAAKRGLWLTLVPVWGAEARQVEQLWGSAEVPRVSNETDATPGLSQAQVGFDIDSGLVTHEGAGLLTTYGHLGWEPLPWIPTFLRRGEKSFAPPPELGDRPLRDRGIVNSARLLTKGDRPVAPTQTYGGVSVSHSIGENRLRPRGRGERCFAPP